MATCRLFATACLAVTGVCAQGTDGDAPALVNRAMQVLAENSAEAQASGERMLREATALPRQSGTSRALASTVLALFLMRESRGTEARAAAEDAVRLFESAGVEDARLALPLEVLASVDTVRGAEYGERARAIRARGLEAMAAADGVVAGEVRRIRDGVTAPVPSNKPEPEFTPEARMARQQGTVSMSVVIDATGVPREIKLLRGLGFGLDEAAYHALRSWRFSPSTLQGEPVPVRATVEMNFRLL